VRIKSRNLERGSTYYIYQQLEGSGRNLNKTNSSSQPKGRSWDPIMRDRGSHRTSRGKLSQISHCINREQEWLLACSGETEQTRKGLGLHWIKVKILSLSQGDLFCADLLKVNSDEKVAVIFITAMEKGRGTCSGQKTPDSS
jgi:hypothetical protein